MCGCQYPHSVLFQEATSTVIAPTNRLVYGLSGSVRDTLHYAEDGSHVYVAGHAVVLTSQDGKTQRVLPGTPDCEGICALALSSNKKLIAVAERAEKAVLTVYDGTSLKRRKQLLAADAGSKASIRTINACGSLQLRGSTFEACFAA